MPARVNPKPTGPAIDPRRLPPTARAVYGIAMSRTPIPLFALAGLCLAAADSAPVPKMRAVFVGGPSAPGNFRSPDGEAALELYRKMGYNVLFQSIAPPPKPAWNRKSPDGWRINPAERAALVERIRSQAARVKAFGIGYCPFYSPWGWGDNATLAISEGRARAAIYRSVDSIGGYGEDQYPALAKIPQKWDEPENVAWSGPATKAIIAVGGDGRGSGGGNSNTAALVMLRNPVPGKAFFATGQCYRLEAGISIPAPNSLGIGDNILVRFSQRFLPGRKPDAGSGPLATFFSGSRNDWCSLASSSFAIAGVHPGGKYDIRDAYADTLYRSACSSFRVSLEIWVEDGLPFGKGHAFGDSLLWEFVLSSPSRPKGSSSRIVVSDFKAIRIDPAGRLAYRDWETGFAARFPGDSLMRTKAIYRDPKGALRTLDYFGGERPASAGAWKLARIQGHFLPYNEGLGGPYARNSLDPLSPPYDLVSAEMLRVIKEGLGGREPEYFHLSGDEVMVFRRDNASRKGGPNPDFASVPDGEFFARVIERDIARYAKAFGIPAGSLPKAKFVVWGDMILPFGTGYRLYAEGPGDGSALAYWKRRSLQGAIQPDIWIYDEMEVPGANPRRLLLEDPAEVQKSIAPLLELGFRYSATYSTYAGLEAIRACKPAIDDDGKHIQHEIDLARAWCDIIGRAGNRAAFEGFIYTGWNGDVRTGNWNGLYPLAYFGWYRPASRDLPGAWKKRAPPVQGRPRLDLLSRNSWEPADSVRPARE